MKLIRLNESYHERWNRLVTTTPQSGFMQSWEWSKFKEAQGQHVLRLGIFENDDDLMGGSMVYCSGIHAPYMMPHGPVLGWQDQDQAPRSFKLIYDELSKVAEETHSPIIRIEPLLCGDIPSWMHNAVRAPLDLIPTPTLRIDLSKSENDLLRSMHPKGRYNIRLAIKKGVEVMCRDDDQTIEDFYFLFELTYKRHNFLGEPKRFFIDLIQYLGPMIRFYFAYYRGMMLCSVIALFFGHTASFLYGGSLPFIRSVMAPYLVHWKIMQDAKAMGYQHYDFFGIAPPNNPQHAYTRFSQFKSKFGGKIMTTVGAYDFYLYPQLAELWINRLMNPGLVSLI